MAIYHTYPHVDFADTGRRARGSLLRLVTEKLRPGRSRASSFPALVRGDELITKTGCYGDLMREAPRLERDGTALAAGIMIGNPFTDVPELCCQVLVATDGDEATAQARGAFGLRQEFWPLRHRMQGKLIALERAIAQATTIEGPVIFTDAADATSSGATGDSNVIIKGLRAAGYSKRVLAQIVDAEPPRRPRTRPGSAPSIDVALGGGSIPDVSRRCRSRRGCSSLSDGRCAAGDHEDRRSMPDRPRSGPSTISPSWC